MPSSLSGRHQKRLQTVLSRAPQDYLFLKVLFEHTFNNVGQDSHCALPLGSVFWRKWDIVVNDLILTWLTRFVLIQDDSASERQTPRLFRFREPGFQRPDSSIFTPNMWGLCRKHSQCKNKPPVTGWIDTQHIFQKISRRRFPVLPISNRVMADCPVIILGHRFHQPIGEFAQAWRGLRFQFFIHDLSNFVAHSRVLLHDVNNVLLVTSVFWSIVTVYKVLTSLSR